MRHLHFDCFSGISGDMTLGALVDAGLSLKELVRALKDLPATGYRLRSRSVMRGGLAATKVDVVIQKGFRSPLPLSRIQRLITNSRLPPPFETRAWRYSIAWRMRKGSRIASLHRR